jgi:hypothetical protein
VKNTSNDLKGGLEMKNCSEMNEIISLYIENELDSGERRKFEEHIDSCPACKKELDDIKQIKDLFGSIQEQELPENFKEELHDKLLQVKEQENSRNKIIVLRSRYIKIISSVAAGLLLIFLVRGFYNFNMFAPQKANTSTINMSMAAEAPKFSGNQKNDYVMSQAPDANIQSNENNAGVTGSAGIMTDKSETGRSSANDDRVGLEPKLVPALTAETASSNLATLTIKVDDPAVQVEKIKSIVVENGGEEIPKNDITTDGVAAIKAVSDSNAINLNFLIPNIKYSVFTGLLNSNYGQANIEPGAMVSEDLTAKLNDLITQSNNLDNQIKESEKKNDTANQADVDKLKEEKKKTENDIENIRLGTDFTNVTIILKSK